MESWLYVPAASAVPRDTDQRLLREFAPLFVIADGSRDYNRIGMPEIHLHGDDERAVVNPHRHTIFSTIRNDRIGGLKVRQLIYRIHFCRFPWTLKLFFEAHRNPGLLAIVTVTADDHRPLFLTTTYTCGCYAAVIPTSHVPAAALPPSWPSQRQKVWGKLLPASVPAPHPGSSRFVVHLESKTHRVTDVAVTAQLPDSRAKTLEWFPMSYLHKLPVEGGGAKTSSFFHTEGWARGYVKNAWSSIEGLTLGLLILDPRIGSDKDFGDPAETGTPFYTMLLPWKRQASRLDRFGPWLQNLRFDIGELARLTADTQPSQAAR